jgi:hypothetical protein
MFTAPLINQLHFKVGDLQTLQAAVHAPVMKPFEQATLHFLDAVSGYILKDNRSRKYSDAITFAFWCRASSMEAMKKKYHNIQRRVGRGVTFHIAPSNIPLLFAYSAVTGLLAGNANLVKLPRFFAEQTDIICEAFERALQNGFSVFSNYLCIFSYANTKEVTDCLSQIADVRMIWGSDRAIHEIRKSPLSARGYDVAFADRYSIAVIDADVYLQNDNQERIAQDFYNDTYVTDQNACSSPKIVIWLGAEVERAKALFWHELHRIVKRKVTMQPIQVVQKWSAFYTLASRHQVKLITHGDNLLMRASVENLAEDIVEHVHHSGYFLEYWARDWSEIVPVCQNRCQTLTYFGVCSQQLEHFVLRYKLKGVDRIVPFGKSMDFQLVWDGFDLIRHLSREMFIE